MLFIAMAAIAALTVLMLQSAAPQPAQVTASTSALTAEKLDQLVAPIALYPDPLIAQILMAATYPLEVVEADRWLEVPANAALTGDALTTALQTLPWDPSIKSLIPFPQVLQMMDNNLDWTEQLGDAFLAQQADVMEAVQRLRQRAEAAGSLESTPQQTVSVQDQEVLIEPASPTVIYLPVYNPWCVYGPWPYPAYPPYYFLGSWTGYCVPADAWLAFGVGIYPSFGYWAWGHCDWRHHHIRIDHDRYQRFHARYEPPHDTWQHNPAHRRGVPYRDQATATRFLGKGATVQRNYRGYPQASPSQVPRGGGLIGQPATVPQIRPAPGRPSVVPQASPPRPTVTRGIGPGVQPSAVPVMRGTGPAGRSSTVQAAPPRPVPPAFQSFGPGPQVRGESARGFSSRTAPAPSVRAAPPAVRAAPPAVRAAPPAVRAAPPAFHGSGGHR